MVSPQNLAKLNGESGRYYIDPSWLDPKNFKPEAILTGPHDYPRWYRKMKAYLAAREKLRFADGSMKAPAKDKTEYKAWKNCNDLVLEWILNSLATKIAKRIKEMIAKRIKEGEKDNGGAAVAWEELKKTYSPGDLLIISQFLVQIHTFKQGNLDARNFYDKIISLWKELDILRPPPKCGCATKCSCDALKKLKKQREEEMLGVFLKGLNARYDRTRSRILKMNPLPSLSDARSMIVELDPIPSQCGRY